MTREDELFSSRNVDINATDTSLYFVRRTIERWFILKIMMNTNVFYGGETFISGPKEVEGVFEGCMQTRFCCGEK